MLKWIAKLLGDSPIDIPEGVPEAWVQRIERLLAPLDKLNNANVRSGIAKDVISYVLHGQPAAVLTEVGYGEVIGQKLGLLGYAAQRAQDAPDVYEHFNEVPPAIALRWAYFLTACTSLHLASQVPSQPQSTAWPQVLLMHCAGLGFNVYYGGGSRVRAKLQHLGAAQMEAMLKEAGIPVANLYVNAFSGNTQYGLHNKLLLVTDLAGYPDALDRYLESIRAVMLPTDVMQRLHVLAMLATAHASTLDCLAPQLCELATGGSKQVRQAADHLLRKCSAAIFVPLQQIATEAKPDKRALALDWIFKLASSRSDEEMTAWARQTAGADKAASVQALVEEWDHEQESQTSAEPMYHYELPKIDWSSQANPISLELLNRLWRDANRLIEVANERARAHNERARVQGHNWPLNLQPTYTDADMQKLQQFLTSDIPASPERKGNRRTDWNYIAQGLDTLVEEGSITPAAMLKLLMFFDLAFASDGILYSPAARIFNAMHQKSGHPTLLEISVMMDAVGMDGRSLLRNYCYWYGRGFATDWPDEDVWPYFAHHMDWVVDVLVNNPIRDYTFDRKGLFKAIATLPEPPASAIRALFDVALGSSKSERLLAQEALNNHPGKEARIIEALSDGKSEARMLAAQWLGRLRHEAAIPALETAVRKEKHDIAKGAMLDSLQLMGQPVEKYLDRDALEVEATKSLAKGLPKDLEWFPWNSLPAVRWADGRGQVPPEVLKWMLVQAVKQKLPEPNAVLRKYCAMFDPVDREALGQSVLETWLREDVRPISPDEAERRARAHAQSTHASMTSYPQYYQNDPNLGRSVEEIAAAYLPSMMRQPEGSATGSKGLLAVVAACASERAVAPTQRYLKEWYGSRAAQGKALIAMLAWIEHPSAIQLMLSIGTRFRTRSFQEEAIRQAEALAERKGWTLSELADRTVPTAGFDDAGVLELDYGPRQFTAKLLPDFKVELFNPDGKKISALPEPRQDDNAEIAKQTKKTLGTAKKELKSIVDLQTDRLYEALCTEREWPAEDWLTYLFNHPVLRHLVQRLVWMQVEDGKVVQTFRPLDDGTLTDCEDNNVELPAGSRVRLAHDTFLDADQVKAWQQHLVDYEIKPLFQQLGKGKYTLPQEKAKAEEIVDFHGHLLESFALRGRATKLGYLRGPAEDGGWFHVYEKRFPTLGLQASIEFTGSPLPEESRTVALLDLWFTPTQAADAPQRGKVALSKVPAVLLSECYNDIRLIAAEGSGFDPDWSKKSAY